MIAILVLHAGAAEVSGLAGAGLMSIPAAYALGWLSFAQLLVVSVIVAAAKIAFNAASGACLRGLVRPGDLLVANARLGSTTWTSTVLGPPLGGAAIGLFGPVTTVTVDAVSYLLSATGIWAARIREPRPVRTEPATRLRAGEQIAPDRIAGTLSAWSASTSASIAVLTAGWGLLATITATLVEGL